VKFCGECGGRLESLCPSCQASNPPTNKFCHNCGAPLAQTKAAAKFNSPDSYTPKHLAEKILTSKSALEGERKQVTVLFADMKGSMELLADRDPEDARKLLDPVLEHMMEAVHRYEGTVNQVMGDGIMALFGAPLAHEDHAVRACYAALRMQESVNRYAEGVRSIEGIPIQIRVGLNSGEVVVRSIGNDLKMDYTAVGQTTHLAARMEQMAKPGSIMMTADVLRLAEGYVQVNSLGPAAVKGMSDPIEVFEVTAVGPARTRFQATASRGLTRFVGRDTETEQLCKCLEKARTGHGQIIAVVGEPGVGKSRLFHEFVHSHRAEGCLVVESGSVSYGKATPYLPVIDLLKAYFKIHDRDNRRDIREKITGKLLTLDKTLESALPAFLSLLDVTVEDQQWHDLDPRQRRQRILEAIKRLLLRESQLQPLVIVIEDLHWIDSETQGVLDGLIDSLPTARILLLVNYRPEYRHNWSGKTFYTQLRLDALPQESAEELLNGLLGTDVSVQPLRGLLITRTEGNPFFLEESVQSLVETKVLVGERGNYRLRKGRESIQVPATVQAVLAARIDRLSSEDKRLLQSAAVIGKDVPFVLLQAMAGDDEEVLRRGLTNLQAAEFLYEVSLFPDLEYTFKHALTHEVAYGSLLQDRRRALHGLIVEAIEKLYPDRLAEHAEILAHHSVRGELWGKAVTYLREAGTRALMRSANTDAVAYLTRGLEIATTLPAGLERDRQEMSLQLALGLALQWAKGFGALEVERAYSRARDMCERVGEPGAAFQALWGLWLFSIGHGRVEAARGIADELLALAKRSADRALLLQAHHAMWPSTLWLGDPMVAWRHLEQGMALYNQEQHRSHAFLYGGHDPGVCCRSFGGWTLWVLGHPAQALERSEAANALAKELAHSQSLAISLHWACGVDYMRRDARSARDRAQMLISISTEQGFPQWRAAGTIFSGWARAEQGEGDAGIAQIRDYISAYRATGVAFMVPFYLSIQADACLKNGQTEGGFSAIDEALAVIATSGERLWEGELYRLKGELLRQKIKGEGQKSEAEAETCFREALDIARGQGARSWELRAAMSLSRLWQGQGKREEARKLLGEIYGWFTEGFDTADLKEAKALLKEL
jgi:class 3 adenylate cyclase/predicted ATPase